MNIIKDNVLYSKVRKLHPFYILSIRIIDILPFFLLPFFYRRYILIFRNPLSLRVDTEDIFSYLGTLYPWEKTHNIYSNI